MTARTYDPERAALLAETPDDAAFLAELAADFESSEWNLAVPAHRSGDIALAALVRQYNRCQRAWGGLWWIIDPTDRSARDHPAYLRLRALSDDVNRRLNAFGVKVLTSDGGTVRMNYWCRCGSPGMDFYFHAVGGSAHGYGCARCGGVRQSG